MSVRFIYGRAGSGKSHFCLEDIKTKVESYDNAPFILLVPEDFSFQSEKELIKVVGELGIMKARVLSFKRMAYTVLSEMGGLTRQHMNNAGKCMMIYHIMDELKGELTVFSKAVKMQGFVNTISDIITELKIYGISPEILEKASEKIEGDEILKSKLQDINRVFSKFEDTLHEKYIDSDDDISILAQNMDGCPLFDGAEVWVDGFSMFTPQQYVVLEKLLTKARRVNITLCMDSSNIPTVKRSDIFLSSHDIESRVLAIVRDNNITLDEPVELNGDVCVKFKDNPELAHLEKNMFAFPYSTYEDESKYISIFKTINRYSEVESIARDIVRLSRDEGIRFGDAAVVTKDVEGYEKLIGAIFTEYGIPYFFDTKRDIIGNPLIVLILSAIEILAGNWKYESVFRYLKTGLLNIEREDIDMLENYVLAAGIKGRRWSDGKPWEFWPDYSFQGEMREDEKERLSRVNIIRDNICLPLLSLDSQVKNKKAVDICAAVFSFLCNLGIHDRIKEMVEKYIENGELDLASEYSKVWNIMVETLDQIVEVIGNEEINMEQFLKVLSIGFREYKIMLIPPSLDQVIFGNIESIKSHNIKVLYIIGANDGIIPSQSLDEGILSDSEREILNSLGLELAPTTRDKVFQEQFLLYTTLTRTNKYLNISYPIADYEGKAMRPSIIISRLKKIFRNISELSNITMGDSDEDNLSLISAPAPTFNELVSTFRKSADGLPVNSIWKDVYSWYNGKGDWNGRCSQALSGISYNNKAQPVNSERVKSLYGKQFRFSISRLEKYAECPFAYFLQYGLKAKERKVYELSLPDLGSFIHSILDSFSKHIDDSNITWRELEKDTCKSIISDIVDKTVDNTKGSILSSSARYNYLKDRLKRIILRAVWLIALHIKRGGFEPVDHEVSFDEKGKYPPISIELPSGEKINLIGRIDRVDILENDESMYVRIVDYKSGKKDFKLSDIYNGLELQLLIYLDAILEYISKNSTKKVIPGGILYFKIDDPIIKAEAELSEEEVEREIMKNLRMKGLLLSDIKVVKEMDREISGSSIIIPVMVKDDGTFGSKSSIASEEDFKALRRHIKDIVIGLCEDMLKGSISIKPYKNKSETSCEYCSYKSVCRFDISIKENSYRIINSKSSDEVWKMVRKREVNI